MRPMPQRNWKIMRGLQAELIEDLHRCDRKGRHAWTGRQQEGHRGRRRGSLTKRTAGERADEGDPQCEGWIPGPVRCGEHRSRRHGRDGRLAGIQRDREARLSPRAPREQRAGQCDISSGTRRCPPHDQQPEDLAEGTLSRREPQVPAGVCGRVRVSIEPETITAGSLRVGDPPLDDPAIADSRCPAGHD